MNRKKPETGQDWRDPDVQADLLQEEARSLRRCLRHPAVEVFFDGAEDGCPACQAAREWLALTEEE